MKKIVVYSDSENKFFEDSRQIILETKNNAIRSVDAARVVMYWKLGYRILEEEQRGRGRADYETYLIAGLASRLEPEFGSGFTKRQLERARQFYRTYPIASALRSQFYWTQYKLLISISDPDKREYYEQDASGGASAGSHHYKTLRADEIVCTGTDEYVSLLHARTWSSNRPVSKSGAVSLSLLESGSLHN